MLFYLATAGLVLLIGLRLKVGADWAAYQAMFNSTREESWIDILRANDPAYMTLNWLGTLVNADVWFTNMVCAALFAWGLAKFANDQPDPWLVLLIAIPYLVIVVAMGYTRQAVAIGMMMAGISAFRRHRYFTFFLYLAVAAAFHKTVVITIPIIVLSTMRQRFLLIWGAVGMAGLLFYVFISGALATMLRDYAGSGMTSDGAGIRVAMSIVSAAIYIFAQRRFALDEEDRLLWRNFSYAAFLAVPGLLVSASSTIVDRVSLYLIPLQLVVLSRLPLAFPRQNKPNALLLGLVLMYSAAIQFTWLNFASHAKSWVPYRSYLTDEQ